MGSSLVGAFVLRNDPGVPHRVPNAKAAKSAKDIAKRPYSDIFYSSHDTQ